MLPKKSVIAGLLILGLYWITNQGYEKGFFFTIPLWQKHAINLSLLIAVGIIGYWGIRFQYMPWLRQMWLLIYLLVLCFILFFGLIDLISKFTNRNFRDFVGYTRAFFTSPLPYAIALFLGQMLKGKIDNNEAND